MSSTPGDEDEPISSDEGEREAVEPRAAGDSWTLGEHARLGLETLGGWSPPAYAREATAVRDGTRGVDSLLPERRHAPALARAGYRPEATIGADERVRIYETDKFPWRAICHLRIRSRFGDEYIGTGWMVGPRTIITAGHCVYLPEMGGWAERIAVSPARNGRDRPFSTLSATKFYSVRGWTVSGKREHDYGAIVLGEDQAVPEAGALGYSVYEVPKLVGSYINLAGYPSDRDEGTTMWWSARRSIEANEAVFFYDADTAAGQSGAPVWRLDPGSGRRVVVGIHVNGARTGNSAVRINERVFQNLRRWSGQAPP